jgi:hypothetical protein
MMTGEVLKTESNIFSYSSKTILKGWIGSTFLKSQLFGRQRSGESQVQAKKGT